ncbi:MAG: hypothetical protein FJX61_01240 [Alphaproteobacteria bacterium]|nr:hypothetical protein [Alphaproteobacteria bacterium]
MAVAALAAGDAWAQARPIERAGPGWIIDPAANCGTSNPFATGRETISWSGKCLRGRLHGPGTLIWFENGFETERDEGTFRNGELHGDAVVTLANKTVIFGNYKDGVRHGEFMVVTPDGNYLQGVYADGELIEQRRLDRDAIKRWREARKGDQRLASITVEVPAREERPGAEPAPLAAIPPPAAPVPAAPVAALVPAPMAVPPVPVAVAPAVTIAAVPAAAQPPLPVRIPATPFIGPLGLSDPYTPLPFPVTAALSGATSVAALPLDPALAQLVRIDGQPAIALATQIPGGINLAPGPVAAAAGPQFAETRILASLLQSSPALRAGAGSPGSRSATLAQGSQTQATRGVPMADEPIVLRPPGSAPAAGKLKLRPPPERPGAGVAPPAASTPEPAVAAPAPAPVAVPERRVALNLGGADIRDAAKLILGDILNVRYSIDPAVRGTVSVGTPPDLATSMLVPWLRTALQVNAADLVVTPEGYRVHALASAANAATLPTLAPPPQAESQFVHAYALERDGREAEAAPVYAALAANFPGSELAAMAGERLAALNRRLDAPRRETWLPAQMSMIGAYLCSRQGYYPNQSKWCGFVRGENGDALRVEVREITYNGLFAIGFRATTCTGGEFIGPTSHGRLVTVPRNCLEARW